MHISFVQPRAELGPFIQSLWVLESDAGMPSSDESIAAPNGCPKLIVPCENSLESIANGRFQVSHEQGLYFVGNRDSSTVIRSSPRKTRFIAIEFRPHGAFPVLGVPMSETLNGLFDAETVLGKWGRDIRETLCNLEDPAQKLRFVQEALVRMLDANQHDNRLIAYCVDQLEQSSGRLPIQELEVRTGYTLRHLDRVFRQCVGLSPKTLARIFRFQRFYRKWAHGLSYEAIKEELNDYYFDQAHFSKEFKRMTGHSPRQFTLEVANEFGRRLATE